MRRSVAVVVVGCVLSVLMMLAGGGARAGWFAIQRAEASSQPTAATGGLAGVVRRDIDSSPVFDMSVRALSEDGSGNWVSDNRWAVTGLDGAWAFSDLPPGRYIVQYQRIAGDTVNAYYPGVETLGEANQIEVSTQTVTVDQTLTVGGVITGACRDGATGAPVDAYGATVLRKQPNGSWAQYDQADFDMYADGYRVTCLPTGVYKVRARVPFPYRPGWVPDAFTADTADEITVTAHQMTSEDVNVYQQETIGGLLTSALSGVSVYGIEFTLWSRDSTGTWTPAYTCMSNSAEYYSQPAPTRYEYQFSDIAPGTYRMTVHDPNGDYRDLGYPSGTSVADAQDLNLVPGSQIRADIALVPALAHVYGKVTDAITGEPIPYAVVSHSGTTEDQDPVGPPSSTTADASGNYSFQCEGQYMSMGATDPKGLHSAWDGLGWGGMRVYGGTENLVDIKMDSFSRVIVHVVDSETQLPIPGITVDYAGAKNQGRLVTDAKGMVKSPGLDVGGIWDRAYSLYYSDPLGRYGEAWYGGFYLCRLEVEPNQTVEVTQTLDPKHIASTATAPTRVGAATSRHTFKLTGRILPSRFATAYVRLQLRYKGHWRESRLVRVKTNASGVWSYGVRLVKGGYRVSALVDRHAPYDAASSLWTTVIVK